MFSITSCWQLNIATAAITLAISTAFSIDACVRQVPALITKARLTFVCVMVVNTTSAIYVEQPDIAHSVQTQGTFLMLNVGFIVPGVLYFLESFAVMWTSADSLRDSASAHDVNKFSKVFPWVRGFTALMSIALCIAWQFKPTNLAMVVYRLSISIAWVCGFVLSIYVIRLARFLRNHRREVEASNSAGAQNLKQMKRIEYQMILFAGVMCPVGLLSLTIEVAAAAELTNDSSAAFAGLTCSDDIVLNILKYVSITIVFFLTMAPGRGKRKWTASLSSQIKKDNSSSKTFAKSSAAASNKAAKNATHIAVHPTQDADSSPKSV